MFPNTLPKYVSAEDLEKNTKSFSVRDVKEFVEKTKGMHGRFQLFEAFDAANDELYLKVAKPLLSIGTVGSVAVERKIKPIKHIILTRDRSRLNDAKGVVLFWASENLRHNMRTKQSPGKKITGSF